MKGYLIGEYQDPELYTKLYTSEVLIVRGGIVIPHYSFMVCLNQGNFAPIEPLSVADNPKDHDIYSIDLGHQLITEIVIIPSGLNFFFIELEAWENLKNECLEIIEDYDRANPPFLLPTENVTKLSRSIKSDVIRYILDS